jgi:hypothetical protein
MERLLVCPGDPRARLQVRQPAGKGGMTSGLIRTD